MGPCRTVILKVKHHVMSYFAVPWLSGKTRCTACAAYLFYVVGTVGHRWGLLRLAGACLGSAVRLVPGAPAVQYAHGLLHLDTGDQNRAFGHLWAAVFGNPHDTGAWAALARLFLQQADYRRAEACIVRARQLGPDSPGLRNLHAVSIAPSGQIAEAMALSDQALNSISDLLPVPVWDGSALEGRSILVWAPGSGFGDYIQFVRYLPLVVERGGRPVLVCRPELRRVFSSLRGVEIMTSLEALEAKRAAGQIDCQAHLFRLPELFKTTLETIPAPIPYLMPPAEGPALPRRDPSACAVGLVWTSGPNSTGAIPFRSVPFAALLPLVATPGTEWFSLQVGVATADLRRFGMGGLIHDLSPQLQDFADTAAAISQLDLVITVDTSVAHLAGAMGKPVWILLPYAADWRWFDTRTDSPWYPSARLFRQPWPGNWVFPILGIREALDEEVQRGRAVNSLEGNPSALEMPGVLETA